MNCQLPSGCAKAVNVGWLAPGSTFTTGTVPAEVVARLDELVATPVNLTRGYHHCHFCVDRFAQESVDSRTLMNRLDELGALGNGEVSVPAGEGECFMSPVLIVHYIKQHGYSPPAVFCDAVLRTR